MKRVCIAVLLSTMLAVSVNGVVAAPASAVAIEVTYEDKWANDPFFHIRCYYADGILIDCGFVNPITDFD